jgi:DNA-binding NarL/FixJ family response regulator
LAQDCGCIFVVDDDPQFRVLVTALFSRAGYVTFEASTGDAALAAAREERPALVLLDISLPDVNGFEVCLMLREEFGNALPIIFVSGERTEPIDRAVGMMLGGDDYIVKPFDPDELLARARRAIVRSHREGVIRSDDRFPDLTPREREVLELLAEGSRPAEIAAQLVISPKTVGSHVQRILVKLGVHSRAQAVALAYQGGLLASAGVHSPDGDGT